MYLLNYRTNNGLHTEMGYRVPVAGLVEERPCDRSDVNLAMESVRGQRLQTVAFLLNPGEGEYPVTENGGSTEAGTAPIEDYEFDFPVAEDSAEVDNDMGTAESTNGAFEEDRASSEGVRLGRRPGRTTKWIGGFKYTRARATLTKVYYRCSHYRSTGCKGKCEFVFNFEAFRKFVPHSCGRSALPADGGGPCVERDVTKAMEAEVDHLAVTTSANRILIWDIIREKVFGNASTNLSITGLQRDAVLRRVNRARSEQFGGSVYGQIEVSPWSQIQTSDGLPSDINFLLFHYSYYDHVSRTRERLLGWAHPILLNMLKQKRTDVFVDGTFRRVPPKFKQCLVFSTYDRPTRSYFPDVFILCTSKKYETYFHSMRLVLDETVYAMDPEFVYCDFEAVLIRVIKDHFPSVSPVGCLFHFKQACRRKMKGYSIPDKECKIAMSHGVLDMLPVIKQEKVKKQGLRWVKTKIAEECTKAQIQYSDDKWRNFWKYFNRTWIVRFPPKLWNIEPYSKATVSRTNNPLERLNRALNDAFPAPHPNLPDFVVGIEKIARRYANLKMDIDIGRTKAPKRLPIHLPKPVSLPDTPSSSESSSSSAVDTDSTEQGPANLLRADQRCIIHPRQAAPASVSAKYFGALQARHGYYSNH
jgi:hypothetical protein